MDELFGDVLERTGRSRRRLGFSPALDVAYTADPPLAIVTAELAGVPADSLDLEIQGRKLILSGAPSRRRGRFRSRAPTATHDRDRSVRRRAAGRGGGGRARGAARARRRTPPAGHGHLPGHADPAERRSGAEHRADQRHAPGRPLHRDGRQPPPGEGDSGPRGSLRRRRPGGRRADDPSARRDPAGADPGRAAGAHRPVAGQPGLPRGRDRRGARQCSAGPGAHGADAQRAADLRRDRLPGSLPA